MICPTCSQQLIHKSYTTLDYYYCSHNLGHISISMDKNGGLCAASFLSKINHQSYVIDYIKNQHFNIFASNHNELIIDGPPIPIDSLSQLILLAQRYLNLLTFS